MLRKLAMTRLYQRLFVDADLRQEALAQMEALTKAEACLKARIIACCAPSEVDDSPADSYGNGEARKKTGRL